MLLVPWTRFENHGSTVTTLLLGAGGGVRGPGRLPQRFLRLQLRRAPPPPQQATRFYRAVNSVLTGKPLGLWNAVFDALHIAQ